MKSTAYWQSGLKEEKIKTRGRHYSMTGQATLAAPFWVLTQSQDLDALGPKDWQLIAPTVRSGFTSFRYQRPEGPAQTVAHLRRSENYQHLYPALTDGAINCQSFGPKNLN